MAGISEGGSYSRDPKTGALTRRTEPVAEVDVTVPAETKVTTDVAPAAATKPAKRSN
ncbi:hypothetical protein SAMN05192571_101143 [Pleomorphomonas diazotrophica]|uniref:hypothetical protein n=1 Tax=Pleomorphomonas diazotrophica TaxID=1166257 RepID=UPI0008E5D836|nr:hypothetical protein [Pleomorphomonas diazotrophica]SFM36230.1 hypothetical protein SAMN05192571_101143 [Pleomorphomonas diazotrophica]